MRHIGHDRGQARKSVEKAESFPAPCESVTATNLSRDSERPHKADKYVWQTNPSPVVHWTTRATSPVCATCSNFNPRTCTSSRVTRWQISSGSPSLGKLENFNNNLSERTNTRDLTQQWTIFIRMSREYTLLCFHRNYSARISHIF